MSVNIAEMTSDIEVQGDVAAGQADETPQSESAWAAQEKHNVLRRRTGELQARTAAENFDD